MEETIKSTEAKHLIKNHSICMDEIPKIAENQKVSSDAGNTSSRLYFEFLLVHFI